MTKAEVEKLLTSKGWEKDKFSYHLGERTIELCSNWMEYNNKHYRYDEMVLFGSYLMIASNGDQIDTRRKR